MDSLWISSPNFSEQQLQRHENDNLVSASKDSEFEGVQYENAHVCYRTVVLKKETIEIEISNSFRNSCGFSFKQFYSSFQ